MTSSPARGGGQGGGLGGGVLLFTSFETYKPLPRVLDTVGQVFGQLLEQNGVQWLALDDNARANIALQIFKQIPVLWIWDNVEPVAGFPTGSDSPWSKAEQEALALFLRMAKNTKAKFLLTSRRDENQWLGNLPTRITLPPMPMQERVQLARALAGKQNGKLEDVADWEPLLKFTQGNPLTLTVLVGQALRLALPVTDKDPERQKAKRKAKIQEFLEQLRKGEAAFDDEASQGRSKSLGASLNYGFEHTFSEPERKVLALLHFFQGFVEVLVLQVMAGDPTVFPEQKDWFLPELEHLTRDTGILLLDRAAETGLLSAHGNGFYSIHPALPWYFKSLFEQYYMETPSLPSPQAGDESDSPPARGGSRRGAARAFVESLGELGDYYHNQYGAGNREVIGFLRAEEANLLFSRQLARKHEWWHAITSAMQGLRSLYNHTGRRAEWKRLVDEIVPDFVETETDGPLPGREEQWSLVTEYRVRLIEEAREWAEAERLQRVRVDWERRRAAAFLSQPAQGLDAGAKHAIRSLAASLHELGQIQREIGIKECVEAYREALSLLEKIDDNSAAASAAFNLGHAYKNLPALRNLDEAEGWYRSSLELRAEGDRKGRGGCMAQLGLVAYEQFNDARQAQKPNDELNKHLNAALGYYQQALMLLPPDAVDDLAVAHNQMGLIYVDAGNQERALQHYNEAVRYFEAAGDFYKAGGTRRNVAIALANSGRLSDGLLYARAALRDFEKYGDATLKEQEEMKGLIAWIEGLGAKK